MLTEYKPGEARNANSPAKQSGEASKESPPEVLALPAHFI